MDIIRLSGDLCRGGVFAGGFGFPVVPEGTARIRFQISNSHSLSDLDACLALITRHLPCPPLAIGRQKRDIEEGRVSGSS